MRKKYLRRRWLKRQARWRLGKRILLRQPNQPSPGNRFVLDYKNLPLMRRFITVEGKIMPRRMSRLDARRQRRMAKAVKTARVAALLPFIPQ
jgi:small subunit ribosomal protein S18